MKITFYTIKNYLSEHNISYESNISDDIFFAGICSLSNSKNDMLSFCHKDNFKDLMLNSKAKAFIIKKSHSNLFKDKGLYIIVSNPYLTYALLTNLFYSPIKTHYQISQNSIINNNSIINETVEIKSNVVIDKNCKIGKNVVIHSNVSIGLNTIIGDNTIICSNSSISNAIIGDNCIIQSGCVIGDKGFGFILDDKTEIIHIGNVVIGNNVQIGSNTTIDRASIDSTIISDNVRIDNLVQIAHGVIIGKNTVIAGQAGVAGSTIIGSNCNIGGQTGIAGHLSIGDNVTIAGKSGVTKNLKDNSVVAGFPALDINKWRKKIAKINRL